MHSDQVEQYVPKSLVYSILWSFAGDAKMKVIMISSFLPHQTASPGAARDV